MVTIIQTDKATTYYLDGKLHREDGPAIIREDGQMFWFLNGEAITQAQYMEKTNNTATQYIIKNTGGTFYFKDRRMTIYHREDGPAYVGVSGTKEWYLNGKRHREDGPAIEYSNGAKEWWLHNNQVSEEDHKHLTSKEPKINIEGKEFTVSELKALIEKAK